jgi:predicted dehydrogenase
MTAINVGIIGLGRHGGRYATHLLAGQTRGRLAAVCRRDEEQGRAFAHTHGVRFHRRYEDLIADPGVQAVLVVTPPSLTKEIALLSVAAGKPLLIEKPLARTAPEARALVEAAEAARVPVMTAQTLRYDEAVRSLRSAERRVGPCRYLVLTNRVEPRPEVLVDRTEYGGRGVLLEIGIHLLDMIRFVTGEEVTEVRCELERIPAMREGAAGPDIRARAELRTAGGIPCLVDVSRVTGGRVSRVEWVGERGQMEADWVRHRVRVVTDRNRMEEWPVEDVPTVVATLDAFLAALESGGTMPITGRDGLKAVQLADACYESAETGKAVSLRH